MAIISEKWFYLLNRTVHILEQQVGLCYGLNTCNIFLLIKQYKILSLILSRTIESLVQEFATMKKQHFLGAEGVRSCIKKEFPRTKLWVEHNTNFMRELRTLNIS